MVRGQTPQALRTNTLLAAHQMALDQKITTATCDVQLALKLGKKVKIVEGDETNIKITTPVDMYIAEHLLRKCIPPAKKPLDFNKKKILLIGASGGIGQKIHQELLEEGAEVVPLSRTTSPISIDLNHAPSILKACQDLKKSFDFFDGCIFCAGKLYKGSIATISLDEVEEMTRVNFTSLIPILQNIPLKKGGLFLLIGSSSYFRGRKEIGAYSATKAASINLVQSLAEERPDLNLQIFCPKRTNTPMRRKNFPLEDPSDWAEPLEVAKTILGELKAHLGKGEVLNVF
jgi:2-C-methyl-D-erythritol 4-phosphate cytidylyltransferase